MSEQTRCRICEEHLNPKQTLTIPNVPKSTFNITNEKIDLNIVECPFCHTVQLYNVFINPNYAEVHRSLSVSTTYREQKKNQFYQWMHQYNLLDKNIIEIGSGNGQIVQIFHELEKEIDSHSLANFDGVSNKGYDGVICFYILEHEPNPMLFLIELYDMLNINGVALIEVPNYDVIEKKGLWLEFTPDHLVYYRKSTLIWLLNECNFQIEEISESANDSLCLSVVVRKPSHNIFEGMALSFLDDIHKFQKLINIIQKPYAIYGAGHYTQVLVNQLSQEELPLRIYDGNKEKCWYAIRNITIVHKESINETSEKDVKTIIINCGGYNKEVFQMLKEMKVNKELIIYDSN